MVHLSCTISCLIACTSTTTLVTLITTFAASILDGTSIHKQAIAAAVLDIIALIAYLVFVIFQTCSSRTSHPWRLQLNWATMPIITLPYTITMVLSIFVLGWMKNNMESIETNSTLRHVDTLVSAAIAMWSIALISLGIYFVLCLGQKPTLPDSEVNYAESRTSLADEEHKSSAFSMHSMHSPGSTTFSEQSSTKKSSPLASVRNSIHQFMQPVNKSVSKTSQRNDTQSLDEMPERSPSDGFETWQVSPVKAKAEPVIPAPVHLRVPMQPLLETIPGSRPVSPAHPLDASINEEDEEGYDSSDDLSVSGNPREFVSRSASIASSTRRNFPPFAPSIPHRPSALQLSHSNLSESHIHPLFRSDSPVPPPLASPGTIVTSSPYAGQIISSELALGSRSRKGSESGPPSPNLEAFRALSRPASLRSIRALAAQQMTPKPSPSLGDLRAECAREMQQDEVINHKRKQSA